MKEYKHATHNPPTILLNQIICPPERTGKKQKTRQHSAKAKMWITNTSTETQMCNPIQHNLI
jgi:hypothetical protein